MSSRKRRIKRKIEMISRLEQQAIAEFDNDKSMQMWAVWRALNNAMLRKGWHKRAMDEMAFRFMPLSDKW